MPTQLQYLLLALIGAAIGSFINWAIYQWTVTMHRPISPWIKPRPDFVGEENAAKLQQLAPRTLPDFFPIYGWIRLRRDAEVVEHWKWAWLRALLIELVWLIGLPLFLWWQHSGGLIGTDPKTGLGLPVPGVTPATPWSGLATTWFWLHTILIALMFIATFIDFDEQMIPDQVTIPGTIIALVSAAVFYESRLPETVGTAAMLPSLGLIDFASPATEGAWYAQKEGLFSCLAIFTVWMWGILPKRIPSLHHGLGIFGSFKIMMATIVRPRRKTQCEFRTSPRGMLPETRLYLALLVVGVIAICVVWLGGWLVPVERKLSLVSAFLGLAIAGGLIWGIRIVGSMALAQEAMGFGDVTLMCMVGAFLGWQASIVGFVYSIVFALVLAIILFVITKKSYLAFGPYLCMGSLLALLRWPDVLREFGGVYKLGPFLLLAFGGSLVLMGILLPIVRWVKESLGLGGYEEPEE